MNRLPTPAAGGPACPGVAALDAAELLARVSRLPPLPQAVHDLTEALREDDVQAERIVQAVASDPALTTTALRLANSSFYGVSGRVVTLRDAVHILGVQTLSAAVMTAAVMSRFDRATCPGFDFDACWRHAVSTALCAQMLAETRGVDPDTAYIAGLLHDIGRLAFATYYPKQLAATRAWAALHDLTAVDAEQELLGLDHAVAGGMVAAHWRLAPAVVAAIRGHHEVPAGEHRELLDVLHLADTITHALDLSHTPDDMVPPLSLASWDRMSLSGDELQQLFARIEARMQQFDGGFGG